MDRQGEVLHFGVELGKEYTVKYDATERFTRDDLEISGYKKTNANALWVKIRHPNDFFALMIYTIQQPIIKNRLDKRRTPLFWSNHSKTTTTISGQIDLWINIPVQVAKITAP